VAWNSELDEYALVVGIGVRSRAVFRTEPVDYVLWNRLLWARNGSTKTLGESSFSQFRTELDVRRLAVHKLYQRQYDFGLYFRSDWYPDPIEVLRVTEDFDLAQEVRLRWQLGFTWGPLDEWRPWWKIKVPRIGLAALLGDGAKGFRLIIRFKY
jgi:hypothetical protein